MTGLLQDLHHLVAVHHFGLEERHEMDVLGLYCPIEDWRGQFIKVVGSYRGILPASAESIMQLFLEIQEGSHDVGVEIDVSEDR